MSPIPDSDPRRDGPKAPAPGPSWTSLILRAVVLTLLLGFLNRSVFSGDGILAQLAFLALTFLLSLLLFGLVDWLAAKLGPKLRGDRSDP